MALEQELARALDARTDALNAAARTIASVRDEPAFLFTPRAHPANDLRDLAIAREWIESAEALSAAILQRCGLSWDALASPMNISRQTVHRRLAQQADRLFEEAAEETYGFWLDQPKPPPSDEGLGHAEFLMEVRSLPRWWHYG